MRYGEDPASLNVIKVIPCKAYRFLVTHMRHGEDPVKCKCSDRYPGLWAHMRHDIDPAKYECPDRFLGLQARMRHGVDPAKCECSDNTLWCHHMRHGVDPASVSALIGTLDAIFLLSNKFK